MAPDELRAVLSPLLLSHEGPTEEKGEGILNRAAIWIWITTNSYVRLHHDDDEDDEDEDDDDDRTVEDRHEKQFLLSLTDRQERHDLSIHASTLEESIICLEYLVGLQDTHFREIDLSYKGDGIIRLCPFGANILEKILQISARRSVFHGMIFTPDHCRILASSGIRTNIEFFCCEFQDEGAAFVEASEARQDETSGPAKLSFVGTECFNARNLALFLNQHKLVSLELRVIHLDSEVSCRAVASAAVEYLLLGGGCDLEDGGTALVEAVREGRGPKDLSFGDDPFDSSERLVAFMHALRGNMHVERLRLPIIDDGQVTQALAAALRENKGLFHLAVPFGEFDESDITELLESISLHPSLRSLDLTMRNSRSDLMKRRKCTKAVADMLLVNEQIDVMSFDYALFEKDDWDAYVVPRLECNLYRKRFPSVQKIEEASTRAAILASALGNFSRKPHLVWMLLKQSNDIVSSYPDSAPDQTSIPLRKRSRSSSSDAMISS
jgi:hypothetical protein